MVTMCYCLLCIFRCFHVEPFTCWSYFFDLCLVLMFVAFCDVVRCHVLFVVVVCCCLAFACCLFVDCRCLSSVC